MNRRECLKLLGLPENASEAQIKRKYKQLAMRLHPDKNPSPDAHASFIQLTEAVEFLLYRDSIDIEPNKTAEKRPSRSKTNQETEEQLKARMEEAKRRFEQQKEKKIQEDNSYYNFLTSGIRWFVFRGIVYMGLSLSVLLSVEYFLPRHYSDEKIIAYSNTDYNGILTPKITGVLLENNGFYYAEIERSSWINDYPIVTMESSWFLHIPESFYSHDDLSYHNTRIDFHIGSVRLALILLFLIPFMAYKKRGKNLWFVFFYHLSFWGIGLVEAYILITDNRLIHLLTFGFF